MGNMNKWRNSVTRSTAKVGQGVKGRQNILSHGNRGVLDKGTLSNMVILSGRDGLAKLRSSRAISKASGKSRKSGWYKRMPQWLKDYLY